MRGIIKKTKGNKSSFFHPAAGLFLTSLKRSFKFGNVSNNLVFGEKRFRSFFALFKLFTKGITNCYYKVVCVWFLCRKFLLYRPKGHKSKSSTLCNNVTVDFLLKTTTTLNALFSKKQKGIRQWLLYLLLELWLPKGIQIMQRNVHTKKECMNMTVQFIFPVILL